MKTLILGKFFIILNNVVHIQIEEPWMAIYFHYSDGGDGYLGVGAIDAESFERARDCLDDILRWDDTLITCNWEFKSVK